MNESKVKFLIIRFSSIGDIVLTSPVARCLKQQVENCEVHYLTKQEYAPILNANPYIDKIHTLKSFGETVDELYDERFDYIIDLHKNLRSYRFKNKLKVMDFSFPKLNFEKWLYVNLGINRLPDIHIVDRYFKTVNIFDVKNDNRGLDYYISDEERINTAELDQSLNSKYIVYGIGGQHNTKKMPAEMIREVCNGIDFPIVLAGGKEDYEVGEFIKSGESNVINLCGSISINGTASIIEQSSLVISHDTAVMHIAAAYKKDVLSVWGNTVPEFGMYPYLPGENSVVFERNGLKCRPCSKIGFKKCPKKHFKCMKGIKTAEISETANNILSLNYE